MKNKYRFYWMTAQGDIITIEYHYSDKVDFPTLLILVAKLSNRDLADDTVDWNIHDLEVLKNDEWVCWEDEDFNDFSEALDRYEETLGE